MDYMFFVEDKPFSIAEPKNSHINFYKQTPDQAYRSGYFSGWMEFGQQDRRLHKSKYSMFCKTEEETNRYNIWFMGYNDGYNDRENLP